MYENVHQPVQKLAKASRIFPGGLCKIFFTPWENVKTWPAINPLTGGVDDEIELQPGTVLYVAELNQQTRSFEERTQEAAAGTLHSKEINATLPGNEQLNILVLNTMIFHQHLIIFQEVEGTYRFFGDQDSGARLSYEYTSGNKDKSRNRNIKFTWSHPNAAPVYLGALSQVPIEIATGGSFMFIERFKVKAGQPITPGNSSYTNAMLAGKKIFMIINEQKILSGSVNDMIDGADRYIDKPTISDTATLKDANGNPVGLIENDNVEIYAHD